MPRRDIGLVMLCHAQLSLHSLICAHVGSKSLLHEGSEIMALDIAELLIEAAV